jgi:hypothetical protein
MAGYKITQFVEVQTSENCLGLEVFITLQINENCINYPWCKLHLIISIINANPRPRQTTKSTIQIWQVTE